MGKIKRVVFVGVVLAAVLILLAVIGSLLLKNSKVSDSGASPTPGIFDDKWGYYENTDLKLKIAVPANWQAVEMKNDGNFDLRAVFTRGADGPMIGNISELSLTITSKPKKGLPLSSVKEFDEWYKKEALTTDSGEIKKIGEFENEGQKAVNLVSNWKDDAGLNNWTISTWFIRNGVNYYVNTTGLGDYSGDEMWVHNTMVSTLTFLE